MKKKYLAIILTLLFSGVLLFACEQQPTDVNTPESDNMESSEMMEDPESQEGILEEAFEARREATEAYIKAAEETMEEIDTLLDEWTGKSEELMGDEKAEIDNKIENVTMKRDEVQSLLEDMNVELSDLAEKIEYSDTDATAELEDAYYDAFLRHKENIDAAITDLQDAYYQAFLETAE
jgi:hypothetical protein